MHTLIIYPGEGKNRNGTTIGHIYVTGTANPIHPGAGIKRYEVAGGPPPGIVTSGPGGHKAALTPPGHYILDRKEHHITQNWPKSVVPWGATIREKDGIIEYTMGGHWRAATGRHGSVTHAVVRWQARSNEPVSLAQADEMARNIFFVKGKLVTEWLRNDFGNWSWNLMRDGHRTAYYVHSTPQDEASSTAKVGFELRQSHGCLHVRPKDRNEMARLGYLKAGIEVHIMRYGMIGPPR